MASVVKKDDCVEITFGIKRDKSRCQIKIPAISELMENSITAVDMFYISTDILDLILRFSDIDKESLIEHVKNEINKTKIEDSFPDRLEIEVKDRSFNGCKPESEGD